MYMPRCRHMLARLDVQLDHQHHLQPLAPASSTERRASGSSSGRMDTPCTQRQIQARGAHLDHHQLGRAHCRPQFGPACSPAWWQLGSRSAYSGTCSSSTPALSTTRKPSGFSSAAINTAWPPARPLGAHGRCLDLAQHTIVGTVSIRSIRLCHRLAEPHGHRIHHLAPTACSSIRPSRPRPARWPTARPPGADHIQPLQHAMAGTMASRATRRSTPLHLWWSAAQPPPGQHQMWPGLANSSTSCRRRPPATARRGRRGGPAPPSATRGGRWGR